MTCRESVEMFVGFNLSCDLLRFSSANFNSNIFMLAILAVRNIP